MRDRSTSLLRMTKHAATVTAGIAFLSFAIARSATIAEAGSTLIFPLFKAWVAGYAKVDLDLHITVAATGSEAGINQVISRRVQIGTSDAYMTDKQSMGNPGILNIPLAISAQTVEGNLPEFRSSKLGDN